MDDDLIPARRQDLEEAIRYALRFSDSGKPLTQGMRGDVNLMARHITGQILRSNFLILRRHHEPGPTPGRCGDPPDRAL